ncbi:MAG TPA: hypothetical protein PKN69_09860 [Candidatus Latescibacteria bacterium]|nr:hypothetical protein [Candidatus Latescibacterota bacterium]
MKPGPDEAGPSKVSATLALPSSVMMDMGTLWGGKLRRDPATLTQATDK